MNIIENNKALLAEKVPLIDSKCEEIQQSFRSLIDVNKSYSYFYIKFKEVKFNILSELESYQTQDDGLLFYLNEGSLNAIFSQFNALNSVVLNAKSFEQDGSKTMSQLEMHRKNFSNQVINSLRNLLNSFSTLFPPIEYEKYYETGKNKEQEFQEKIEIIDEKSKLFDEQFIDLEKQKAKLLESLKEANIMHNRVSESELTKYYSQMSKKFDKKANRFLNVFYIYFGVALLIIGWLDLSILFGFMNIFKAHMFILLIPLHFMIIMPMFYLTYLEKRNRGRYYRYKDLEVSILTSKGYLGDFNDEFTLSVKSKLAEKYFGEVYEEGGMKEKEALNLIEKVSAIVKK